MDYLADIKLSAIASLLSINASHRMYYGGHVLQVVT